ncbi:hypothetical protein ACWEP4_42790 [Streptomyces sp. NPDC004227]
MTVQPVTTTQTLTADRSWLDSLHGTDSVDTITLDMSTFASGTHYKPSTDTSIPYSRVLSGIPVGKITASGLYGLYKTDATDGRQNLAGSSSPRCCSGRGRRRSRPLCCGTARCAPRSSRSRSPRLPRPPPARSGSCKEALSMSVQDLIKDISVADLTTFARYIPTPADFLLTQTVFAKVSVQDVM